MSARGSRSFALPRLATSTPRSNSASIIRKGRSGSAMSWASPVFSPCSTACMPSHSIRNIGHRPGFAAARGSACRCLRLTEKRVRGNAMPLDTETMAQLRETVRRFVRERLIPNERKVEENDQIPADVLAEMRELGLFGLTIPEEFGCLLYTSPSPRDGLL